MIYDVINIHVDLISSQFHNLDYKELRGIAIMERYFEKRERETQSSGSESIDELQEYLIKKGIQTLIHYPVPPHKQHTYIDWNSQKFGISEKIH